MLSWLSTYLPSPADDRLPFELTTEQARWLLTFYALDEQGTYVYRRAILEMAKGWGKSPLAGAVAIAELAGPTIFDGWDADGFAVGRKRGKGDVPPLVQIAAVSEDQADNTYGAIYHLLTAREGKPADELGIDVGRTRLYLRGRPGELQPVTASAGSREGQRVTFAVLDETHLWRPDNGGVKLAATLRRNAGKMNGRTLETTNAPRLGDKSVAERSETDLKRGFSGIFHYARRPAIEPQEDWDDGQLLGALAETYGDASWIDLDRILKEIHDPSTAWEDAVRYYFNIRKAGVGRAVDPRLWDERAQPRDVPAKTRIGMGFDGSISRAATILQGCTADGYSFRIGQWIRPPGATDWTVPREEVHAAVEGAFARYDVGRFLVDPPKWWTELDQWIAKYGEETVVPFDTNQPRRMAPAVDRWLVGLKEGTHTHDGDPVTREHVIAAHLRKVRDADLESDGRTKYVLVAGDERRFYDAAVADVLAFEAAMTMPAPEPKKGGWAFIA